MNMSSISEDARLPERDQGGFIVGGFADIGQKEWATGAFRWGFEVGPSALA